MANSLLISPIAPALENLTLEAEISEELSALLDSPLLDNPYINSLLWGGNKVGTGPDQVIEYSFLTENPEGFGIFSEFYYPWLSFEVEAAQAALETWSNVANISFVQAPDNDVFADFQLAIVDSDSLGSALGMFIPPGEPDSGLGLFNFESSTWTHAGLQPGGNGFVTLIHELGHGLGLAHPHDNGGGSGVFPGVLNPWDLGTDELNQGIWTTMSYNDGLVSDDLAFDSVYGYQATPMAFDIAAVQALYGANWSYNTGDDAYSLPSSNGPGTFYAAIWDAGGIDTIDVGIYTTADAVINLNAAPLVGPNAGGYLSKVEGVAGGLTIANGVIIENAIGSGGNDILIGNQANNTLTGGVGNDILDGREGDDRLYGGTGDDALLGFDGDDWLYGEAGDDELYGELGDDWLEGGTGHDSLYGGAGDDVLDGMTGDDLLVGGDGDDTLLGFDGDDVLNGGDGNDLIYGEQGNDLLDGGLAHDRLYGGAGDDRLFGFDGDDILNGGEGDDVLYGELGHDRLEGGAGDDTLLGADGHDELFGGEGHDQLFGEQGIDVLDGGSGNDELYGGADDDFLDGMTGDDLLEGGAGDDQLLGFDGDDILNGGEGDDVLYGEHGDDLLNGGAGDDSLYGDTGADWLDGMSGDDWLYGGDGDDVLLGFDGDDVLNGDGGADILLGEQGDDFLDGSWDDDTLNGGAGNDVLLGSFGDDVLTGGGNQDLFIYYQGDGWDVITDFGGVGTGAIASSDTIQELDQLQFIGAGFTADKLLLTQTAQGLLIGFEALDPFLGQAQSVLLLENVALESLDNLPANASVPFVAGNILFDGQSELEDSFDVFDAHAHICQVLNPNSVSFLNDLDNHTQGFEQSDDVINGQGGNDILWGLSGDDVLRGGSGDDTLVGGAGIDQLWGGEGCDRFALGPNQGLDFMFDFEVAHDVIVLTNGLNFDTLFIGQLDFNGVTGTMLSHQFTGEGIAFLSGVESQALTFGNFAFA